MNTISISSARFEHVEAITQMVHAECHHLWPPLSPRIVDAHARLCQLAFRCHHRNLLVLHGERSLLGAVLADKLYFRGPEITFLIVAPGARRQGRGIDLLQAACRWLGAYPGVTWFVPRDCPALAGLAYKTGFRPTAQAHTRLGVPGRMFQLLPDGVRQLLPGASSLEVDAMPGPPFVNPIGDHA